MDHYNSGESHTILRPIYVPPTPSCRRPLRRMTERFSQIPILQNSRSPKPGDNTSRHRPELESPEISSDENDEDNEVADDSFNEDTEYSFEDQETLRQRYSPPIRLNTPKSNCDPDGTKQRATPPQCLSSKPTEKKRANLPSEQRSHWIFWIFIGISIAGIAYLSIPYMQATVKETPSIESKYSEGMKKFKESIKEIKGTFPGQIQSTWVDIEAAMNDLMNGSEKPWVIVLYSNETREISCLAKMLGKASSKALHSEESLELKPDDLGQDYGIAIDRWKLEIEAKKAVVVYDVLEIDPRAIQAFHTMCDRESPLVKNVVYFLTLITSGNISRFEKPEVFVENQLTNRFLNKLPKDKIQPLITRLTDGPIISVMPEMDFTGCPM